MKRAAPPTADGSRGFTLVEMIVTMALLSMIMLAISSTVVIASYAVPSADDAFLTENQTQVVLARLAADLAQATHLPERAAAAVTLVVHDRDHDGRHERLRYAWAGPGQPVTYQYNNDPAIALGPALDQFALTYDQSPTTETIPGPAVEDTVETELARLDNDDDGDVTVKPNEWHAQLIRPSLPADATAYRVSRALLRLERKDPLASGQVGLRRQQPDLSPAGPLLSSTAVLALDLSANFNWYQVGFSNAPTIPADEGVWLSFEQSILGDVAKVRRSKGGQYLAKTSNGAASWSIDYGRAMKHYVYGYVTRQTAATTVTRRQIDALSVTLRAAAPGARPVGRRVDLPNRPPVLAAFWETDFLGDPTTMDINGDGVDDWQSGNTTTLLGQLLGGLWKPTTSIAAQPLSNFSRLTTVDLWVRATAWGGAGPGLRLDADRDASLTATLRVEPSLQADGSQTLRLYHHTSNLTRVLLAEVNGLTPGLLKVRLVVDPQRDTVSLWEHGAFYGTYRYTRYTRTSGIVGASCYEGEAEGSIDYLRIAVEE